MKPSQKFKQPKNKGSIHPLGFVLKYDPPIIGLLYKQSPMDKKKKVYNIHLKELIYHDDEVEITKMLFYEHPKYLDPDIVEPEQVLSLVSKLLDYRDMRMEEMDEYFLQQEEGSSHQVEDGDETESQYIEDDSRDQESYENDQKLSQLQKIKENEKKKLQMQQQQKKPLKK